MPKGFRVRSSHSTKAADRRTRSALPRYFQGQFPVPIGLRGTTAATTWKTLSLPPAPYAAESTDTLASALASVITSGQAPHAASPDCKCHRQCGRMEHSGSTNGRCGAAVRPACSLMMRSTMPHLPSAHWTHAACLQVLLNRNRFSGERPWRATSTKEASTTMRSFENATEPSARTIPIRLAPASHPQLGQRIGDFVMLTTRIYVMALRGNQQPCYRYGCVFLDVTVTVLPLAARTSSAWMRSPPYQ